MIATSATLYESTGSKSVQLPYQGSDVAAGFDIRAIIARSIIDTGFIKITPDDCLESLEINYVPVPLPASGSERCDYSNGLVIDARNFLSGGDNVFLLKLLNKGGPAGLRLENAKQGPSYMLRSSALIVSAVIFFPLALLCFGSPLSQSLMFSLGIAISSLYLVKTDAQVRGNDVDGHIAHIEEVQKRNLLTKTSECWQCYHPPVYYWTAALAALPFHVSGHLLEKFYQWLSYAFYLSFVIVSLLLINRLLPIGPGWLLANILLIFWPAGFLRASAIGNDVLLYLFAGLQFYFLWAWIQTRSEKNLWFTLAFLFLAIFTKSNGVLLAVPLLCALVHMVAEGRFKVRSRKFLFPTCFVVLSGLLAGGLSISKGDFFTRFQSLNSGLMVSNSAKSFLFFDAVDYFTNPYTSAWADVGGRQYFWNYLTKTSLFGEFDFLAGNHFLSFLALMLSTLLIAVLVFFVLVVAIRNSVLFSELLPCVSLIFAGFFGLVFLRIVVPFSCSGDFRYIHFIVLPFAILSGLVYDRCNVPFLRLCMMISVVGFGLSSALFYGYFVIVS